MTKAKKNGRAVRRWSSRLTREGHALDLESGVFKLERQGRGLSARRRKALESAKDELRSLYHRD